MTAMDPVELELICGRCPAGRGMATVTTWRQITVWAEGVAVFRGNACGHLLRLTEAWVSDERERQSAT